MRSQLVMVTALACTQALAFSLIGCDSTESGLKPVGGEKVSPTEVERFVRRAHLDMLGKSASDDFVATERDELIAAGNTAAARGDLVTQLLADPDWATAFVDELENRAFAGDGYEFAYALSCNNARNNDPACSDCQPNQDQCSGCTCAQITTLLDERTGLENAEADLVSGDATSAQIERRFADSSAYRFGQAIPTIANNMFEHFLARPAEPDELDNASALIVGFVAAPGNAAGLLFNRHGSNYADLVDIIFTSELYRNAVVIRSFDRLLGRIATPREINYFSKDLDEDAVDIKDVLTAIVSSGEYFGQ